MLNNLFSFTASSRTNSSKIFAFNKNSIYLYNLLLFVYSLAKFLIIPFQRTFINTYSARLQLNRLPFRSIPNALKHFLIFLASTELWILFFKRIKNKNNLYILREKKKPLVYRFWCVFYKIQAVDFNELNVKCKFNKKTTNVYNLFKVKNSDLICFNLIVFYYVNKVVLLNYPYYYWAYMHVYNKYEYSSTATKQSRNNREVIMFLCINAIKTFFVKNSTSFIKTTLTTFKGVRNTLKNIEKVSSIDVIKSTKILHDSIKQPLIASESLFERNFLKNYNTFFKPSALTFKFYIHSIIYKNTYNLLKKTTNKINNVTQFLTIHWYNKVHNTIINITKTNIVLYLRASRHFNKGRYSRNRQLYRTGVYWCIWLNVVIVYALHYYFYRVVFSFGYFWLPLGLMILVMFSSRLYKYRYYDVNQLVVEFKEFGNFIYYNTVYFNNKYNFTKTNLQNNAIKFYKNYMSLFSNLFTINVK